MLGLPVVRREAVDEGVGVGHVDERGGGRGEGCDAVRLGRHGHEGIALRRVAAPEDGAPPPDAAGGRRGQSAEVAAARYLVRR